MEGPLILWYAADYLSSVKFTVHTAYRLIHGDEVTRGKLGT